MEFDNTFAVTAPIDEVWNAMLDVERVAPCVPGAKVTEKTGENAYKVSIKVKLGPMSMTYKGDVEIVEQDDAARRAVLSAKAQEARGQGTADAKVEMRLTEQGATTQGTIHTDVAISGKAAAMGQGVIGDVSAKLIDTFAANLAAMLGTRAEQEAGPAAPPGAPSSKARASTPPADDEGLPIVPVVGSVIAGRMRDPRVLAGTLISVAVVFFWLGRRRRRRGGSARLT